MLILDEPTNHLDVDAREALVQALNDYGGAVVIVSHDRHMLELTADRLILVDGGTAREFPGSLDDYTDHVLGQGKARDDAEKPAPRASRKDERRQAAEARERSQDLRKAVKAAEAEIARLTERLAGIDHALSDPARARGMSAGDLMKQRAEVEKSLADAETRWLEASEALEQA